MLQQASENAAAAVIVALDAASLVDGSNLWHQLEELYGALQHEERERWDPRLAPATPAFCHEAIAHVHEQLSNHPERSQCLVAYLDGDEQRRENVAGFLFIREKSDADLYGDDGYRWPEIETVVVRDSCRRRGVAHALMTAAEAFARSLGAHEMRVGVLAANTVAYHLYSQHGFASFDITMRKELR